MANNPTNHRPSFDTWVDEMIEDLDAAAEKLFNRADKEFIPKVALNSSLDLHEATVHWTDVVNGVINTLQKYGKQDLAHNLTLSLHNAVAMPDAVLNARAWGMTIEEIDAILLGDDEQPPQ